MLFCKIQGRWDRKSGTEPIYKMTQTSLYKHAKQWDTDRPMTINRWPMNKMWNKYISKFAEHNKAANLFMVIMWLKTKAPTCDPLYDVFSYYMAFALNHSVIITYRTCTEDSFIQMSPKIHLLFQSYWPTKYKTHWAQESSYCVNHPGLLCTKHH